MDHPVETITQRYDVYQLFLDNAILTAVAKITPCLMSETKG